MTRRRAKHVDPRIRLGIGIATMGVSLITVHRDRVGPREERVFRRVNELPDSLFVPAWVVMQLGTVGAALVASAVARASNDRRLAARLLIAGTGTWAASKIVKPLTGRPRPLGLLPDARLRGREAAGLGYPSGHAGVAVALGVAGTPKLPAPAGIVGAIAVPIVGMTRMYVGAHLPLDVVSGAALGLAIDALVEIIEGP